MMICVIMYDDLFFGMLLLKFVKFDFRIFVGYGQLLCFIVW